MNTGEVVVAIVAIIMISITAIAIFAPREDSTQEKKKKK